MSAVHVLLLHVLHFHVQQFRPFVSRLAFSVIPYGCRDRPAEESDQLQLSAE